MIIDAMDILYSGKVNAFCIMSSDSDFTGIVKRLKESGIFVCGAGKSSTPQSFVHACDRFWTLEEQKQTVVATTEAGNVNKQEAITPSKEDVLRYAKNVINDSDGGGGVLLSNLIATLYRQYPNLDFKSFGCRKPLEFFTSCKSFIVTKQKDLSVIIATA